MCDSSVSTPRPEAAARADTNTIVHRQSPRPPITVPMGVPSAVEAVRPATTTDNEKPRFSVGTKLAAAPVAAGTNIDAPRPARTRAPMAMAKLGASAVPRLARPLRGLVAGS
jgi:hypothetical protein